MEKKSELFVYYDPEYDPECTWKWIAKDISEKITKFLQDKRFKVLKAEEMRETMLSVVKREKTNVVIVFAQDVAPDTILDDITAMALVRQYLDNGGSIVWIGDIPFYYQARKNGIGRINKWATTGVAATILNVNPIFAQQIEKAILTEEGKRIGVNTRWSGIRPVLIDKNIKILAKARCSLGIAYYRLPTPSWWSRLRGVNLGVGQINFGFEMDGSAPREGNILHNCVVANAWFKNFDNNNPKAGFYRIWDYKPLILSDEQLEDLYRVTAYSVD